MTMIGEVCRGDVVVATRGTTVADAARLMRNHHVGSVVVVDRMNSGLARPVGIVTDRDIAVEVTATGLDPNTITAGDIMLKDVATVRGDKGALDAMRIMRLKGVRRLPVVTEDGSLIGLVAFDDLLDLVSEELAELTRAVGREQAQEATQRR